MREVLVSDLVRNLLGPRNGPDEVIDGSPVAEYITGVLAPVGPSDDADIDTDPEAELDEAIVSRAASSGSEIHAGGEGDADTGRDALASSLLSPVLDPKKAPSSMGITFAVSCSGAPALDVCVTWGRYAAHGTDREHWKRSPRHFVASIKLDKDIVTQIGHDGMETNSDGAEISLHAMTRKNDAGALLVSLYVVNRIKVPSGERSTAAHHVFQPQIRVSCGTGTKITSEHTQGLASGDDDENETLYRNKRALARGHMTSAVWRDVDPEATYSESGLDFPECESMPGFAWADRLSVPPNARQKFTVCDARTEFVPMYNVLAPDFSWPSDCEVALDAKSYFDEMDPERLRQMLLPFDTEYKKWLDGLRVNSVPNADVKRRLLVAIEEAHGRIRSGISLLCDDEDARLAFCFASKAIDLQSQWLRGHGIKFRPFQLGFILMSLESILRADSAHREVCDLLWVPTGGGKTESYLFLVALVAAHRRLRASRSKLAKSSGDGVSVISRYTLRLLSIQQFRRAVSLFTAMEYLRVDGLGGNGPVGWRPKRVRDGRDFLWGTAQFSVGLWVGRAVTPNTWNPSGFNGETPGAIDLLKDPSRIDGRSVKAEPAQILECPACKSLLALPESGTEDECTVHYTVHVNEEGVENAQIGDLSVDGIHVLDVLARRGAASRVATLSVKIKPDLTIKRIHLVQLFAELARRLKEAGFSVRLAAAHEARPGYFFRSFVNTKNDKKEYDFQIFCPNPECCLVRHWASASPTGSTDARVPDFELAATSVLGVEAADGNHFGDILAAFAVDRHVSDRVPIPALTTDTQVYGSLPTMVIGTVDKFARIPFEAKSAALFGEASYHHCIWGYCRSYSDMDQVGRKERNYRRLENPSKPRRPDLIIQDEVHLVDGPLGSIFGMYEAVVDKLSSRNLSRIKYIASTATTRRSADHILSLFGRRLALFPPPGMDADDRFFVREIARHPLDDKLPGRLHLGVCAPGRGPLTPLVRIWSRMAQSAHDHRTHPGIDRFWTLVGYFNTIRELAGAAALYMQDIPDYLRHISPDDPRPTDEYGRRELSGRTPSYDLPVILDLLDKNHTVHHAGLDSLFTTSMFGTGVDVARLGAMLVSGQPKTAAAYIQSTGRVGRKSGAIVVTFYRASKPRDLNNYEFFVRQHSQLHRFVEPSSAFPFAARARERTLGPAIVGLLRNMRNLSSGWTPNNGATHMGTNRNSQEVEEVAQYIAERSQHQPESRRPRKADVENDIRSALEKWQAIASRRPDLLYHEYMNATRAIVLGDLLHEHEDIEVVYRNTPSSMRHIEDETGFET